MLPFWQRIALILIFSFSLVYYQCKTILLSFSKKEEKLGVKDKEKGKRGQGEGENSKRRGRKDV